MAGELILNEVATPSTPASSKDAIYMSNEAYPRLRRVDAAGTVWPFTETLMVALASNYTLSNVNTAQKAFNATTNGAITLPATSSYLLEGAYLITNTGTTGHTWGVLFGGTATLTSGALTAVALTSGGSAIGAAQIGYTTTLASSFTVTATSSSATENVEVFFRGVVRINAAGTFIPQVQASVAPGGTQTMLANSYIMLTPFGNNVATNLGNWS